jgi:hypothetical protein
MSDVDHQQGIERVYLRLPEMLRNASFHGLDLRRAKARECPLVLRATKARANSLQFRNWDANGWFAFSC